jgi:hypothetical protein
MWIRTVEPDRQQHSNECRIAVPGVDLARTDVDVVESRSCDEAEKFRRFGLKTQSAKGPVRAGRLAGIECRTATSAALLHTMSCSGLTSSPCMKARSG